jgi:hypothetical protein
MYYHTPLLYKLKIKNVKKVHSSDIIVINLEKTETTERLKKSNKNYLINQKIKIFILRTKYVPSLVKIHWRMLILECSQGCDGRTEGRVTISLRNFVGEGIIKLVPQGNITVVHRSTNVMFHVCPEMYPFLHSRITILTRS